MGGHPLNITRLIRISRTRYGVYRLIVTVEREYHDLLKDLRYMVKEFSQQGRQEEQWRMT